MSGFSGVLKIVRFNWPWYLGAIGAGAAAVLAITTGALAGPWTVLGVSGLFVAAFWMLGSLAVSHYVYDRSSVSRSEWLANVDVSFAGRAAIFHAGQDEASTAVAALRPSARVVVFDFHETGRAGTPSLERARRNAPGRPAAIDLASIPLQENALELALIVFAAHEIRQDAERAAFLREVARTLSDNGRVLVVEHLRDVWNLLAYGPGAFHFLSRGTWMRTFEAAGIEVVRETSLTPFVRVFELARNTPSP